MDSSNSFHRLRRDVAAEMRAIEMNFLHSRVGRRLRGFQILHPSGHAGNFEKLCRIFPGAVV